MGIAKQANGFTGFQGAYLLRRAYDAVTGISNPDDKERPFALIAHQHRDGDRHLMSEGQRIAEYELYEINKYYNTSLDGFLNWPRARIEMVIKFCKDRIERQRVAEEKAKREAGKDGKGGGSIEEMFRGPRLSDT